MNPKAFNLWYPGVLVSVLIGIAAMTLSQQYGMPVMILAVLLGLALHSLSDSEVLCEGFQWSAQSLLYIGVALLGLKIDIGILGGSGVALPGIAVLLLISTLGVGFLLSLWLVKDKYFSLLIASAVAICGISAAAAVFCALPKGKIREDQLALTIGGITVLSTLAMILYPAIAQFISLSDTQSGVFLGGSLHNVSQAVGAGYAVSDEAGDIATLIKLIRVALLFPVILFITVLFARHSNDNKIGWKTYLPPFLIAFFCLSLGKLLGWIPQTVADIGSQISEFFLIVSLVAIGIKTNMKHILSIGPKPILALSLTTLFIAAMAIVAVNIISV